MGKYRRQNRELLDAETFIGVSRRSSMAGAYLPAVRCLLSGHLLFLLIGPLFTFG
jgi:hypothetical protein